MLSPAEIFPAGVAGLTTRLIDLSTGIRVRVVESGPRDGPPVIMLHGWGASLYMFRHALALLPPARLSRDCRRSSRLRAVRSSSGGRIVLARRVSERSRRPARRARAPNARSLVGQSMGGGVALRYALRSPERVARLVLINPVGLVPIGWVALVRLVPRCSWNGWAGGRCRGGSGASSCDTSRMATGRSSPSATSTRTGRRRSCRVHSRRPRGHRRVRLVTADSG